LLFQTALWYNYIDHNKSSGSGVTILISGY
jgi:hypothetical protein